MHGGSSLYALDEEALAAAEPDLILTQELCHVCAVSYREVNEVARAIDADITVVSLEPTSIEGILNTISTVGAMAEAEDAAVRRSSSACASGSARVETQVAERREAGHRAPRVVGLEWLDPPFAVGPLGPRADPAGRRLGPARRRWRDGPSRRPGTRSPRSTRRCCSSCRAASTSPRPSTSGQRTAAAAGSPSCRRSGAARSSRSTARRTSAGPGRGSSTASRCWPRSSIPTAFVDIAPPGGWTPVDLGRPARAVPRDVRLPLVRRARMPAAAPDDLEGWAQLCPDCLGKAGDNGFLRFRLRQALTERATRERRRCRRPADRAAAAPSGPPRPAAIDRRPRPVDGRLLRGARAPSTTTGTCAAAATSAAPIHDAAWNAELDMAGRWLDAPADRAARSSSSPPGTGWWSPLLASRASCRCTTRRRRRSTAPASGSSPTGCAPTSTSATPGPSRTAQVDAALRRLLAEPRPARAASPRSSRSSGAGSSPAGAFAFIDSLPDPASGAADHPTPADDLRRAPPRRRPRRSRSSRSSTAPTSSAARSRGRRLRGRRGRARRGRFFLLATGVAADVPGPRDTRLTSDGRVAILRADVPPLRTRRSRPSAPASWPRR